MKLLNTIEISPYDYANSEYEHPKGSVLELSEEWNKFWKRCISDKNLGKLNAIRKGSYLVDIETISDNELEEIVKNKLKEVDLEDYEEQVSKMDGGIVICENNTFLIEPTCCGDIGNIKEWEHIFDDKSSDWFQLWIGHPWVFYKRENDKIEFSDYTESNLKNSKDIRSKFHFLAEELKKELERIRAQQNHFEIRIRKALDKMGITDSEHISKLMTGNN